MIKKTIKKAFAFAGYELKKNIKTLPNPIELWKTEENFGNLYARVQTHTLVSKERCYMLYQFFQQARSLSGDVAEVGVYRGGTAKLLALLNKKNGIHKNIFLFDTFEGMPETSQEKDFHQKGDFSDTSLGAVSNYLKEFSEILLYRGLFPNTAAPINDKNFSFVHIDVDIYQSVYDCCNFFYNRMNLGGIIVFDDYGFISCPGAKTAVDEFFKDKKENPIYLESGQAFVAKL